ncbi:T6SS immunity protein Tli4 family protein [Cupriavidus nantongensis]|uniref:T6SS immunity protein Tli4 family protein n=1 Tax=Cupriavidus nantongensis TaxID=1796606 RepID=UPI002AF6BFEF|nr:T6SS immunity protein Tli4 family protein [Cupriavidus nantongensis]
MIYGFTLLMAVMMVACGESRQARDPKTTVDSDRFGKGVEIPNASHRDKLAAKAAGYVSPENSRVECFGRMMFDVPNSAPLEWAVPYKGSHQDTFDNLSQYFENGTGKGRIEIETKELLTTFSVYGPVTKELREKFLGYRARMNAASLSGLLSALEQQKKTEDMYKERPELLGPGIKEHVAEERARLEKNVADIRADRYQKAVDLGRDNSMALRHDQRRGGASYLRGAIVLGNHLVAFESMLRGDIPQFEEPSEAQWQVAENALRKLVGQLQPRNLYEIPKDRGFCLPYAFLSDDGTYGNKISTSFRFGDSPAVIYTLSVAAIPGGGASETTILNATGRSATGLLSHLPENTTVKQRLGPRSAKIGALTAEQGGIVVEAKRPGQTAREGYHVYTGYAGWAGSQILPTIEVVMESAARASYPKLTMDAPPYQQSRPRLDALLKSIRLRPTTPPMPELVGIQ